MQTFGDSFEATGANGQNRSLKKDMSSWFFPLSLFLMCTSVEDTLNELRDGPAGRRPPKNLVRLSEWYGEKSPQDHEYIRQVVEQAVHSALFGTLCVLDGVRAIEGIGDKSEIEVFAVSRSTITLESSQQTFA